MPRTQQLESGWSKKLSDKKKMAGLVNPLIRLINVNPIMPKAELLNIYAHILFEGEEEIEIF
jgi:hypothetical protein